MYLINWEIRGDKLPNQGVIARELSKRFNKRLAVDAVSFQVDQGTVFGLLGPNGAGKTTIIRMLTTLLSIDGGQATVAGFDVATQGERVRASIGLSGQFAAIDEALTGRENLEMVAMLYGIRRRDARVRSQDLLESFELSTAGNRPARTYSGGMRRRLDLAATLVARPPILFLDEPTTGLDPRSRVALWELIESLVKDGTTIILTTQYLEEADRLASRIALMNKGTLVKIGTPSELKRDVGGEFVRVKPLYEHDVQLVSDVLQSFASAEVFRDTMDRSIRALVKDGPSALARVIDEMLAQRIEIDEIGLFKPNLDDVFLSLTGASTDE